MQTLISSVDRASASFADNDAAQRELCRRTSAAPGRRRAGRTGTLPRAAPRPRQAAAARARRPTARRRQPVPGDRAAGRRGPVRRRLPRRRTHRRHRHGARPARARHLQRRHRQGRHLLPDHGEEAPAGPGDRAREPPAVHLPGRLRRGLPAQAGRGVPRPGPLRPHLLQPGADVRGQDPADRLGDGLLHRRRRLRAGDERRDGHRAEPGHDLPRRPAAGEGGDRRDRHRGGTRRRRPALPGLRRHRPPGRKRHARPRRSSATSSRRCPRRMPRPGTSSKVASRSPTSPNSTAPSRPTCRAPTTCTR